MVRSQEDNPALGSAPKTAPVQAGPAGCEEEQQEVQEQQEDLLEPAAAELDLLAEPAGWLTSLLQTKVS